MVVALLCFIEYKFINQERPGKNFKKWNFLKKFYFDSLDKLRTSLRHEEMCGTAFAHWWLFAKIRCFHHILHLFTGRRHHRIYCDGWKWRRCGWRYSDSCQNNSETRLPGRACFVRSSSWTWVYAGTLRLLTSISHTVTKLLKQGSFAFLRKQSTIAIDR